jgi:hypothetical protein
MTLEEDKDGWSCALSNSRLQMIQIDFRLSLLISNGIDEARVHIETAGKLKSDAHEILFVPEDTQSLAPILRLFNNQVIGIRVDKIGKLTIEFERNRLLKSLQINLTKHGRYHAPAGTKKKSCWFVGLLVR